MKKIFSNQFIIPPLILLMVMAHLRIISYNSSPSPKWFDPTPPSLVLDTLLYTGSEWTFGGTLKGTIPASNDEYYFYCFPGFRLRRDTKVYSQHGQSYIQHQAFDEKPAGSGNWYGPNTITRPTTFRFEHPVYTAEQEQPASLLLPISKKAYTTWTAINNIVFYLYVAFVIWWLVLPARRLVINWLNKELDSPNTATTLWMFGWRLIIITLLPLVAQLISWAFLSNILTGDVYVPVLEYLDNMTWWLVAGLISMLASTYSEKYTRLAAEMKLID